MREAPPGVPASLPIPSIRDEVRARLKALTVLRASGRAWAHTSASDRDCAGCKGAIRAGDRACRVEDGVVLHPHLRCFKLWVEEAHKRGADTPAEALEVHADELSPALPAPPDA